VFTSICVVGAGRVGQAVYARLAERAPGTRTAGRDLSVCAGADLVLLCVPDREIAGVAAALEPGPWVAHVSGATRLGALAPHERRFSMHPLQTFQLGLGPEQLDGAFAAASGESEGAVAAAFALAQLLGLTPFALDDDSRPTYHVAATMAASFLVTLYQTAADLAASAGAPPEGLVPLMRRTIDNGFAPTGPFVRGDAATIESHLVAVRTQRPQFEPLYRAFAELARSSEPR
jgi:predicted short-subunit dehydrogenase-like oxidoreductase (DUF2520 family)